MELDVLNKNFILSYIGILIKGKIMAAPMPRPKGVGRSIAYKLLGVPPALAYKPSKKEKEIDKKLTYSETTLVR